jgi:hypothetical protein
MREKFFGPLGFAGIRKFIDPQNPTRAAVLMEVPNLDLSTWWWRR